MNSEIAAALSEVYTTLPGVIVDYNGETATVRPALDKLLANGEVLAAPQIVQVPVHWPTGDNGRAIISTPLKPGDSVTLHFSCRSMENWLSGADGAPDDPRQFDLTDCFASPNLRPGRGRADTENVSVQYNNASLKITPAGTILMSASAVMIDSTVTVTGDVIAGGVSLRTHRHTGVEPGSSTSGGPTGV